MGQILLPICPKAEQNRTKGNVKKKATQLIEETRAVFAKILSEHLRFLCSSSLYATRECIWTILAPPSPLAASREDCEYIQ